MEGKKSDRVVYRDLSYRIMEAVFEVHNSLGPGFVESVYEEALAYELEMRGIHFERQRTVTINYKERIVGTHRIDLIVDNKVILELKAVSALRARSKITSHIYNPITVMHSEA
jgi:GxxExxY protein